MWLDCSLADSFVLFPVAISLWDEQLHAIRGPGPLHFYGCFGWRIILIFCDCFNLYHKFMLIADIDELAYLSNVSSWNSLNTSVLYRSVGKGNDHKCIVLATAVVVNFMALLGFNLMERCDICYSFSRKAHGTKSGKPPTSSMVDIPALVYVWSSMSSFCMLRRKVDVSVVTYCNHVNVSEDNYQLVDANVDADADIADMKILCNTGRLSLI